MVLWEITLGTAYLLGLKRTYRLAIKIQRRIVGPKYPQVRNFLHRRTRAVFDVALKVHRSIQERDIEVGRNFGNWILRWLDRMKPSANIRGDHPRPLPPPSNGRDGHSIKSGQQHLGSNSHNNGKVLDRESDRHFFSSPTSVRPKTFPTLAMMLRPTKTSIMNSQYRHLLSVSNRCYTRDGYDGVFRKDIMQWILQYK